MFPAEAAEIIAAALGYALKLDHADKGSAQLFDPETHALSLIDAPGFDAPFEHFFETVYDDGASCAVAAKIGGPVAVPDIERSPVFVGTPSLDVLHDSGSRSCISIPVISRTSGLVGMFSVHHSRPHQWDPLRIHELEVIAEAAAQAIPVQN